MRFKKYYENIFRPVSDKDLTSRRAEYATMKFEEWLDNHVDMLKLNEDGTYNSNVDINLSFMALTKLPIKFNKVFGYFDVTGNFLKNLEGSPSYVGGGFYASHNLLETMKGGPKEVNSSFYVNDNKLTSLKYGPKIVNGLYNISINLGPDGNGFTEDAVKASYKQIRSYDTLRQEYDVTV